MKKFNLGIMALATSAIIAQAGSFSVNQYVKVERSKAKYENVTRRTPYEECWDERVPVKRNHRRRYGNNNNGLGTLIGGVAGGILGHQIGGGSGKTVATVGGAIIGSIVGNNLSRRNYNNDNGYEYVTYETRRRCKTHYNESSERKFAGYKNIGYYKGKKILKYSQRKLNYIPVTITVSY